MSSIAGSGFVTGKSGNFTHPLFGSSKIFHFFQCGWSYGIQINPREIYFQKVSCIHRSRSVGNPFNRGFCKDGSCFPSEHPHEYRPVKPPAF